MLLTHKPRIYCTVTLTGFRLPTFSLTTAKGDSPATTTVRFHVAGLLEILQVRHETLKQKLLRTIGTTGQIYCKICVLCMHFWRECYNSAASEMRLDTNYQLHIITPTRYKMTCSSHL